MKKYLLLIVCFIFIISCSKTVVTTWTFQNRSSEKVYIFNICPEGQPSNVVLDVSADREVTVTGNQIDYDYGPADSLRHQRDTTSNRIIFYNKD